MKLTKQQNKKRYELHRKLRKQGFLINAKKREIKIKENEFQPISKELKDLTKEFSYNVQYYFA